MGRIVSWTNEQNRLLEELAGKALTAAAIAAEINRRTGSRFTRDAVIGRARRAGAGLLILRDSHARLRDTLGRERPERPPLVPVVRRRRPGRLLLNLGWLGGGFR